MLWFVKVIRSGARDANGNLPAEVWSEGEVIPTLNQFDNTGESRATVIIFYGNRVDDIRMQGDVINTLQARMGTGGGNMPLSCYPIDDGREMEKNQNGTGIGEEGAPSYTLDRAQHASVVVPPSVVRRLTPTECERLQGFPDGWTEGQTDGHRYKQMGNAVAVPVVEWIMERLVHFDEMVQPTV
jgi:DNA (cytosine-5)-methyltransferase 1